MGPLLPATAPATARAATSALPHHLPAAIWTIHIICWCHHCRQLRKQQGPQHLDDKYVLAMLLLLHKARGAASEWAPYINSLPDIVCAGMHSQPHAGAHAGMHSQGHMQHASMARMARMARKHQTLPATSSHDHLTGGDVINASAAAQAWLQSH